MLTTDFHQPLRSGQWGASFRDSLLRETSGHFWPVVLYYFNCLCGPLSLRHGDMSWTKVHQQLGVERGGASRAWNSRCGFQLLVFGSPLVRREVLGGLAIPTVVFSGMRAKDSHLPGPRFSLSLKGVTSLASCLFGGD
jgi:hypothetical protein